jgi:hypothetical protein
MMKTKLYLTVGLLIIITTCFGQQTSSWDKWSWLIGEWKGEGSGEPGQGSGIFTFQTDLNDKILVRKAHSEYPATAGKPAIVHDDLLIVYLDYSGNPAKAIYFDNEGHTINYSITYSDKTIVLLSDRIPHVPVFRLTYTLLDNNSIDTKFEMSQNGEKFMTYIEGKSKKIK